MTVKITAVIADQKVSIVVDGDNKDVMLALKMAICQTLAGQLSWLQLLEVTEG